MAATQQINLHDGILPDHCMLCPRDCGANRAAGERGVCGADDTLRVARAALHVWEEPVISVGAGSGTVFFSHCPLHCVYCQNSSIACGESGIDISTDRLCEIFWELKAQGAANINLVTPTHYSVQIVQAITRVRAQGFDLPFVYNTSGFEHAQIIRALKDDIDVYLCDYKYPRRSNQARAYSHAAHYGDFALEALRQMFENVGEVAFDTFAGEKRMVRGIIVRHLLLPGGLEESICALKEVFDLLGNRVKYSLMSQYTPLSGNHLPERLRTSVSAQEYELLLDAADEMGIEDYFWQDGSADSESFIPDFDNTGVLP